MNCDDDDSRTAAGGDEPGLFTGRRVMRRCGHCIRTFITLWISSADSTSPQHATRGRDECPEDETMEKIAHRFLDFYAELGGGRRRSPPPTDEDAPGLSA